MTGPHVSAVIVAWNAGPSLASCVGSLRESARRASRSLQVVVIDNASRDLAVDALPVDEGDVVVRNAVNAGYGVAAAQGSSRAAAPWILLANPDVVVDPDFVGALLAAADGARPEVATLVPELRFASRPHVVNCRGLTVDEIGVPAEVDAGVIASDVPAPSAPVVGGSSGCCLLRAEHLHAVGGPEPAYFAYLEDVDLALRLRYAGFDALYVPGALAYHEGSATTGKHSPLKIFLVARNRRLLFRLHGPRALRARAWRTLTEVGHAVYSSIDAPIAPWRGRFEALRLRRYAGFLRRARSFHESSPSLVGRPKRSTLTATLKRKRRLSD